MNDTVSSPQYFLYYLINFEQRILIHHLEAAVWMKQGPTYTDLNSEVHIPWDNMAPSLEGGAGKVPNGTARFRSCRAEFENLG